MKHRIAIFLSGSGSNARTICNYFINHPTIEVSILLSNKTNSGAASIGEEFHIPVFIFNREEFYEQNSVLDKLTQLRVEFIVLAGFLWMVPNNLLQHYPDKILNIHPALLPKYGGKGMHGRHVHQAVYDNKEQESGITIHLCNEHYDEGMIVAQYKVQMSDGDTPDIIAQKIQSLEHQYYAKTIEAYINGYTEKIK